MFKGSSFNAVIIFIISLCTRARRWARQGSVVSSCFPPYDLFFFFKPIPWSLMESFIFSEPSRVACYGLHRGVNAFPDSRPWTRNRRGLDTVVHISCQGHYCSRSDADFVSRGNPDHYLWKLKPMWLQFVTSSFLLTSSMVLIRGSKHLLQALVHISANTLYIRNRSDLERGQSFSGF